MALKKKTANKASKAPIKKSAKKSAKTAKTKSTNSKIPLVGIGGSAGSIAAFEQFFVHMPGNTGAAFVIAQHFAENQETMLPEIIARNTQMKVSLISWKI
jgi:two-component system CheB/CheR fusion protein